MFMITSLGSTNVVRAPTLFGELSEPSKMGTFGIKWEFLSIEQGRNVASNVFKNHDILNTMSCYYVYGPERSKSRGLPVNGC